ncbi:MAG: nucleoside deaminase [Deltaproteobacteria bacterium]|nr:nucleoside deaminase [Deltaproteobacteria bacterium]
MPDHVKWMRLIVEGAKAAAAEGEEPAAAVVVQDGQIIGLGRNSRNSEKCGLGHAVLNALLDAKRNLGLRPKDVTLYCTLEPCAMCLGATIFAGINTVVYGTHDDARGAVEMFKEHSIYGDWLPELINGVLMKECEALKKLPSFKKAMVKSHTVARTDA